MYCTCLRLYCCNQFVITDALIYEFLKDVANELNNGGDTNHAYRVLRTVFHALREILTIEESMHMIAQLPILLKAVYVEGWKPAAKKKPRSMGEFLECLRANDKQAAPRDFGDDTTSKHHVRAMFNVLQQHVTTGEIIHIMDQFPGELVELWSPQTAS